MRGHKNKSINYSTVQVNKIKQLQMFVLNMLFNISSCSISSHVLIINSITRNAEKWWSQAQKASQDDI